MKKLLFILSVVSAVIYISCDNENTVNPQPTGQATIRGTVYADIDEVKDTDEDSVDNVKVFARVWESGAYTKYYETTTDANGKYSVQIEVGNKPLEVRLQTVDFERVVPLTATTSERRIFLGSTITGTTTVFKGGEFIVDLE